MRRGYPRKPRLCQFPSIPTATMRIIYPGSRNSPECRQPDSCLLYCSPETIVIAQTFRPGSSAQVPGQVWPPAGIV